MNTNIKTMKKKPIRRLAGNLPGVALWLAFLPLAAFGQANYATPYTFTTLAGNTGCGSADGTNGAARFAQPYGTAVDTNGNVYVADYFNDTIRKMTPVGTNWVVTTLAGAASDPGSADGTGSTAQFYNPQGVAVDTRGNLYVGDGANNTIRKGLPARSVPPPILQPPSLSAGQFGFGITGIPGLALNIESSGDFSQWQAIGTCTLEGGTNYFVSPNPSPGAQFYRAQVR
jgi:hypothetical protein